MKKRRKAVYVLLAALLLAVVFTLGYFSAGGHSHPEKAPSDHSDCDHAVQGEVGETIWTCSMHPQIRLPEPGKCPICFMDLIPVAADEETGAAAVSLRQVRISAAARKLAEVEVSPVVRRAVHVEVPMFGNVDYDETRLGYLTAWMAGRIDKLYVNYTGSTVRRGAPMASIYSPDLITAQAELIQAVNAVQEADRSGLKRVKDAAELMERAAREKLRLLGLSSDQIRKAVETGTTSDHITLHAAMGGVVIEKDVFEGMYVQTGTRIFTIADLTRLWIVLEAYESDLRWIRPGMEVEFQTEAYPGEIFTGKTVYIDPVVNEKTRTVRVRLDAANPDGRLKPGMFVRARLLASAAADEDPLVIPASAPLLTGKRAIVYVQVPGEEGTYEGKEIVLGSRAGGYYIVRQGLSEGELVVTKGNFKIDSAMQLRARPSMMSPYGGPAAVSHDHGPATPAPAEESPPPPPTVTVPAALASQLPELAKTYDTLKAAVEQRDLQKTRESFQAFHDVLSAVDPASLEGEGALVWKEVTMLLRNDTMLGSEADTNSEALRLFETMEDHYSILSEYFHLEHILQAEAVSESVPPEFKKALGELLQRYFGLKEALAGDDFPSAEKAAEQFASALVKMDMGLLKGEAHVIWMETLGTLNKGVKTVRTATDIETARNGFELLSIGMTLAVERLGLEMEGPVFELFCPMAFENRGAAWLQQTEEVRNPYFGAMMLACGEVKRQLKRE